MRLRSALLLCSLTLSMPATLLADPITYTYTGSDFSIVVTGAYSNQDFVSGSFTVSAALPDSMPLTSITPVSFSFSDGVNTISSSSPVSLTFEVGTDASGAINQWQIVLNKPCTGCYSPGNAPGNTFSEPPTNTIVTQNFPQVDLDYGEDDISFWITGNQSYGAYSAGIGEVDDTPGVWTDNAIAATPEPSSFILAATGLFGCAGALRRRVQRRPSL